MIHIPGQDRERMPALDGLRAVAVLLVFIYHVQVTALLVNRLPLDHPLDVRAVRVTSSGWVGVDLFFVLSGFLITRILLEAKGGGAYFRPFYARRFLRIIPAYVATLVLLLMLVRFRDAEYVTTFHTLPHYQGWFWLFLANLPAAFPTELDTPGFVGLHLWSLAIEEQFYLVWPAVVLLTPRRALPVLCVALAAFALLLRILFATETLPWGWLLTNYYFTLTRMDALAIGALVALVAADPSLHHARRAAPWLGSAALLTLIYLGFVNNGLAVGSGGVQTAGYTALAVLSGACILALSSAAPSPAARLLSGPVITSIGRYSYGIYLIHSIVIAEIFTSLGHAGEIPTVAGSRLPIIAFMAAVSLATSYSIAWASWHVFESQVLKLKRFFPYGARPAASAAPVIAPATPTVPAALGADADPDVSATPA